MSKKYNFHYSGRHKLTVVDAGAGNSKSKS